MDPSPRDRLDDQAVNWLVRLHSGRATAADRRAFQVWRGRSAAHETAARQAEALWHDIGATDTARAFAQRRASAPGQAQRAGRLSRRTLIAGGVGAMAATAAVVVAGGALGPVAGLLSSYSTGIGGRREIALPDGSTAYLNTSSAISLAFDAGQRRLSLDTGEALFAVAADAARPFAVSAAAGVAVAHGTVFGMRRTGDEVGVFVAEGSVEVQLGSNPTAARLEPGQGLRYRHGRIVTPVTAVDIAAATAWQRGKLIFNRRPLAEVTRELERYRFGRIVIANAALRDMPVTGVFDLADTDAALDTIERTLPIKVSYLPLLTVLR